jgi:Na+-transporting methylmalonyl-CoA/oxaloacetate decarboxylase gamma subunit
MKIIGFILIILGIGFSILSIVFLIKAIFQLKKLKNVDIKIEITERKEPKL